MSSELQKLLRLLKEQSVEDPKLLTMIRNIESSTGTDLNQAFEKLDPKTLAVIEQGLRDRRICAATQMDWLKCVILPREFKHDTTPSYPRRDDYL